MTQYKVPACPLNKR